MMKQNRLCALIALVILGFALGACEGPLKDIPVRKGLTVYNLPGAGYTAYVFRDGTDITTFTAISGALGSQSHQALGPVPDGEVFTLHKWNGSSSGGEWNETGIFPVLLLNVNGSVADEANPMYRYAQVKFTNGTGMVYFTGFAAVTGSGKGLHVHDLSEGDYSVYVFNSGVNVFSYAGAQLEMNFKTYQALGAAAQGEVFALHIWTGMSVSNEWNGSGSLPVLLVNADGEDDNPANPRYLRAMVSFTNGIGSAKFVSFIPAVFVAEPPEPDKGLTISEMPEGANYTVYILNSGAVSTYADAVNIIAAADYQAVGVVLEAGFFELYSAVQTGLFAGNGLYQVLLVDAGGGPDGDLYYTADLHFDRGIAAAGNADFEEIIQPRTPFYKVHFEENAANVSGYMLDMLCFIDDEERELTLNDFRRNNITFTGWNTKADGSGAPYADRQLIANLAGDRETFTLYAQWQPERYTVHFNQNDNYCYAVTDNFRVIDGTMENEYIYFDATITMSSGFTVPGYTVSSWNTRADGTGRDFPVGEPAVNIAGAPATVTLYAQWRPITYTVHFDSNSPGETVTGSMSDQTLTYDEWEYLNPSANGFLRAGQAVCEWNTEADGSGVGYNDFHTDVFNLAESEGEEVTLYAFIWDDVYTVRFESNGGGPVYSVTILDSGMEEYCVISDSNGVDSVKVFDDFFIVEPANPAHPDKYTTVGGWSDGSTEWDFDNDQVHDDITLSAQWRHFEPGDIGPCGGYICYYDDGGFTMADTGELCKCLEAAPWPFFDSPTANPNPASSSWAASGNQQGPLPINLDDLGISDAIGAGRNNCALLKAIPFYKDSPLKLFNKGYALSGPNSNGDTERFPLKNEDGWFIPSHDELVEFIQYFAAHFDEISDACSYYSYGGFVFWSSSGYYDPSFNNKYQRYQGQSLGQDDARIPLDYSYEDNQYSTWPMRAF